MNELERFCALIAQLTPIELALLGKQLDVALTQTDGATPRDGAEVIDEIVAAYAFSNRARRRTIARSVRATVKQHGRASNAT